MYKYDRNESYKPGDRVIRIDFGEHHYRLNDGEVVDNITEITGIRPNVATKKFLEIVERKSLIASFRVGIPVIYRHDLPAVHYPEPHRLLKVKPLMLPGLEEGYEGWKPAGEVGISIKNDKGELVVTNVSCIQPSLLDWSARSLYEVDPKGGFTGLLKDGVASRLSLVGGLEILEGNKAAPELPFFRYSIDQVSR